MHSKIQTRIGAAARLAHLACFVPFALITACGTNSNPLDGGLPDASGADGDGQCEMLCATTADCCAGQVCMDGVCGLPLACPHGCQWECDRSAGQVCNRETLLCEQGPAPVNCIDLCDCYAGDRCVAGQCVQACEADTDCPNGQVCGAQGCQPATCASREDCAGDVCLVCKGGHCTAPAAVCQGDADCCVGTFCNFGLCAPIDDGCQADSDCHDPDLPRCEDHKCVPAEECASTADCATLGDVCQDGHCVTPGCNPQTCPQGQWCDAATGLCKPGCDSNDDCVAPATCNYGTHQCGQADCCGGLCAPGSQVCDPGTCQCQDVCVDATDCPPDFTCRQADGQCAADQSGCDPADFSSPIACGGAVSDTFEPGCEATQRPGCYAKQFVFAGTAGQTAVIDLSSSADTYLFLLGPVGGLLDSNDDGGSSSDSQIIFPLAADGNYTIEATTFTEGISADFDLSLTCSDGSDCTAPISCEDTAADSWTPECLSDLQQGSYARDYTFAGTAGSQVSIDLTSDDADTYLYLLDPTGGVVDYNDDATWNTSDSQIVASLPIDGQYTIEATTLRSGRTGDFELSLHCTDASDCIGPITCGQTIQSAWTNQCESPNRCGSYAKQYTFMPVPYQRITIDLISPTVDTYLLLGDSDGYLADYDDDGGAGSNSRITYTPRFGGTWLIEATTFDPHQTGDFEITLSCH